MEISQHNSKFNRNYENNMQQYVQKNCFICAEKLTLKSIPKNCTYLSFLCLRAYMT